MQFLWPRGGGTPFPKYEQAFIKYKCLQMNDFDGKIVDWLKSQPDITSYSDFLSKHFSLSETDIEKLEPKKKRKKRRKRK